MLPKHAIRRVLVFSVAAGVLAGCVIASIATSIDWVQNPGRIFHQDGRTDWAIVAETVLSWFWPSALIAGIAIAVLRFMLAVAGARK